MHQKGFIPLIVLVIAVAAVGGIIVTAKITNIPLSLDALNLTTDNNIQTPAPFTQTVEITSPKAATPTKSAWELLKSRLKTPPKTTPANTGSNTKIPAQTPTSTPIPVKVGSLSGQTVGGYYSRPLAQTNITISGQGITKNTTSDNSGNFSFTNLPIGKYTLSFTHPEYNFNDWKDYEVKEGENILPRTPNGFLKVFKPTTIKGSVFVDHNNNNQKDNGDEGLKAMLIVKNKIGDSSWGNYKYIDVDNSGNFSLEIPEGSIFKIFPTEYTYYNKPAETAEFIVDGYGGTKEFNFAYFPTSAQAGLILQVFNDKNENGIQDTDEEYIDYYYAEVTNTSTGQVDKTSVGPSGTKVREFIEYGNYNIKLIAGDQSWAYYYKITKGEASVSITNTSGQQTVKLGAHKLY